METCLNIRSSPYFQTSSQANIHMTHFGIICPATTGHLNPMTTLGWELQQRSHQVTLFGLLDVRAATYSAGLGFGAIGESDYPLGAMAQIFDRQGRLSGLKAVRYTITWIGAIIATFLKGVQPVGVWQHKSHRARPYRQLRKFSCLKIGDSGALTNAELLSIFSVRRE
jgi:hypothetical protein